MIDGSPPPGAELRARLRGRTARLAVWGLGYIGYSTVTAFADADVDVVGYDPDPHRVAVVRRTGHERIDASDEMSSVLSSDCLVHMVAVPTERAGAPFSNNLVVVVEAICDAVTGGALRGTCPLVIVESTLTPGTTATVLLPLFAARGLVPGRDLLFGLAPRRDWFLAEGYGLRELDRIYAGTDDRSAAAVADVLSLVNDILHRAPGTREGELVKCVENAYRHMDITLANELTLAFPDVDMTEVLRLVGTKWNIGTYHPSFGTGGYCIPLASRYLLQGAPHPEQLGLLQRTVEVDDRMRTLVAEAACARPPIVILGIAYKGGIKVDVLSPAHAIIDRLRANRVEVTVHDPMYSDEEIERALGAELTTNNIVDALRRARTVLVVPDHPNFTAPTYIDALNYPRDDTLVVIDNHGALSDIAWADHVVYRRAGSQRWLDTMGDPDNGRSREH